MKLKDFENDLQTRQHFADLYTKLRQARRQAIKIDIKPGRANEVNYKAMLQWLNSAIDELTIEDGND